MEISLTREEFIQRLNDRNNLLVIAMEEDLKQLKGLSIECHTSEYSPPGTNPSYVLTDRGRIVLSEFIGKVILDYRQHLVNLVFQDLE